VLKGVALSRANWRFAPLRAPIYNACMAETKPIRLTEAVKAAG
jgi:hypothetical protein